MPTPAFASSTSSPDSAVPSGLLVAGRATPIPLEHVTVEARVVDLAARVTLRQRYRNREDVPLEVVYVFPLDEAAAVCGFSALVDGVRYDGVVKERDEAFAQYDDAMAAGHGAFLLDEERADVLTVSLGNLKPASEVDIEITYVTELASEGQGVRFTLPTTVSPRYAPAEDQGGVSPTPAEALNPPVQVEVPYRFTFDMDITMGGAIRSLESPSHPIGVELDGAHARVRLAQREAALDGDLVVVVAAQGLDVPRAVVERGPAGEAAMVSFVPSFAPEGGPAGAPAGLAEVVFVIDRSGFMGGDSIAEVRNALQLCLRSLRAGCRFNIVSFGTSYAALFPESLYVNDEASLQEAAAFVTAVDANMGGTEILPALEYVVSQKVPEGLARQVVLLTDGEVTNTDAVVALASRHKGTSRFFTFGIGAGASQHLVRGIARATGGAAEFIAPGERVEPKVMRQFKRLLTPAFLDARVTWPGSVTAAPASLPAVFDGERLIAYALAERISGGTATLSGHLAGRAVTFEVVVDPERALDGTLVATLAARARIRDLEEEQPYLAARGSRQTRARSGRTTAHAIAALGVQYQLVSRETSFVAIERRDTPTTEPAELRRVPIALTRGWGGAGSSEAQNMIVDQACLSMPASSPRPSARMARREQWMIDAVARCGDSPSDAAGPAYSWSESDGSEERALDTFDTAAHLAAPSAPYASSAPRPHDALIALQGFDGSWALDHAFADAVWMRLTTLEGALAGMPGDEQTARRALATAMAIAWLEVHAIDAMVEWEMLADKGVAWLESCGLLAPDGGDWIPFARGLL